MPGIDTMIWMDGWMDRLGRIGLRHVGDGVFNRSLSQSVSQSVTLSVSSTSPIAAIPTRNSSF